MPTLEAIPDDGIHLHLIGKSFMQRSVEDWLSLLEKRHPTEIELGLDRIAAVADHMGISPGSAHVITVAGTNGKGSTCAMIDALVSAHGYRTGRYASPHLLRFHERITVTGNAVEDTQLLAAFSAVEVGRGDISLTFFEFTTLAAFWCFQQSDLDVWIVDALFRHRLTARGAKTAALPWGDLPSLPTAGAGIVSAAVEISA